jgi:hypothetical protein
MFWRAGIALILALSVTLADTKPAAALNAQDYFTFGYSIVLSKTEVEEGESFHVSATVQAVCTQDLPLTFSEAVFTGRIIARNLEDGTTIILCSEYITTVKPFPSKQGDTAEDTQSITLQFPEGTEPGTYSIIAELIRVKAKFLVIWVDITNYLPASERSKPVGSVTLLPEDSTSEDTSGNSTSSHPEPGVTDISQDIGADGTFLNTVITRSPDGNCQFSVNTGTKAFDRDGTPLTGISVFKLDISPEPPANASIVGDTYDLKPDGAAFSPAANLTIGYAESEVPTGIDEEELTISMWDDTNGQWTGLTSTVDTGLNTVTAPVSHFTAFAILACSQPAGFTVGGLSINPAEATAGEEVTVSVLVTNTGDLAGSYEVVLKINNVEEETRQVTLEAGAAEQVFFNISRNAAGRYSVDVNGRQGTFTVNSPAGFTVGGLSISPAEATAGEEVTVSVLVTNTGDLAGSYEVVLKINNVVEETRQVTLEAGTAEQVFFNISRNAAGRYSVDVNGRQGTFTVNEQPNQVTSPSWWLISAIVVAAAAVGLLLLFMVRRRNR